MVRAEVLTAVVWDVKKKILVNTQQLKEPALVSAVKLLPAVE